MNRTTVKNIIFIPLIILSMTSDWWSNSFKTVLLYPEMFYGVVMIAALFAYGAPLAEYFSDGDRLISSIAFVLILVGFAWSMLSGWGAINQSTTDHKDAHQQRQDWKDELNGRLSEENIEACLAKKGCVSENLRDRKTYILNQLETGDYSRTEKQAPADIWVGNALLFAISSLPLFSFIFARILAKASKPSGTNDKKSGSHHPDLVPDGSPTRNSKTKNPEPVQKKVEPTKVSAKKKAPSKTRERSDIPTARQAEKLEIAYKKMIRSGENINNEKLGLKASVRKGVAGRWRKDTDLDAIAGTEIVPTGKPKLYIAE